MSVDPFGLTLFALGLALGVCLVGVYSAFKTWLDGQHHTWAMRVSWLRASVLLPMLLGVLAVSGFAVREDRLAVMAGLVTGFLAALVVVAVRAVRRDN